MLLFVLNLGLAWSLLHLFASNYTPFDLNAAVNAAVLQAIPRSEVRVTVAKQDRDLSPLPAALVLDYTYSVQMSAVLQLKASAYLNMWGDSPSDTQQYASVFAHYLQALNMTQVRLISDTQGSHLSNTQYLTQQFPTLFYSQVLRVSTELIADQASEIVGRLIKSSGATVFCLFTTHNVTATLLRAFEDKRMNRPNYGFFVTDEGRYFTSSQRKSIPLRRNGLLYVAREDSWQASSKEEGEAAILVHLFLKLQAKPDTSDLTPVFPAFYLVNMQSARPTLIATSPTQISATSKIVFPGNSTTIPTNSKVSIPISINSVFIQPDGSTYPFSALAMRGAQLAVEDTNRRSDLLPNFYVAWKSVPLSGIVFNYNFTLQRVKQFSSQLGLMHVPPPFDVNVIQLSYILRDLNLSIPLLIGTRTDRLASPAEFPYYLRTRSGNFFYANVMAQVFKFFKWRRLAIIYALDKGDNEEMYRDFLYFSKFLGLNITNDEDKRAIPAGLTTAEQQAKLNASLAHIMQSDVRILVILSYDVGQVMAQMYDIGIRNQYLNIFTTGLSYSLVNGDGEDFYKRRVITKGAMQFFPRTFVSREGERVRQLMIAKDGMTYFPNGCFYFDCVALYLHATDYMIHVGLDYENLNVTMKAMRGTHFHGCAGLISIAPGTNERSQDEYSLINVKYFEENDTSVVEEVMYYNPFSATLINIFKPIQWPDNSTGIYLDTLNVTYDCPFPDSEARTFTPGVGVGFAVCFAICLLTGTVTVWIWRKWWNKRYSMLVTKYEMSADDVVQLAGVPVEFFQYTAMGPNASQLSGAIATLSSTTTLQVEELINFTGDFYWTLVKIVLALLTLYLLLCIIKATKLDKRLEWMPAWSFVMLFANLLLPVVSTLLFLPIVSTLSHIYLCFHSTGSSFTSSYLNKDCYESCWTGHHVTYVISCSVALCIYIPIGVYTRPLWQEMQPTLHIRSQPLPLMVKSLVQVLLLTLDHTLKVDYSQVHGTCFLVVMTAYLFFLIRYPQYNYHRYFPHSLNLWQVISLLVVLFYAAGCLGAQNMKGVNTVFLLSIVSVVGALGLVGLLVQTFIPQFHSRLYRKSNDTRNIINFAFSFGKRANKYLEEHRRAQRSTLELAQSTHRIPASDLSQSVDIHSSANPQQ